MSNNGDEGWKPPEKSCAHCKFCVLAVFAFSASAPLGQVWELFLLYVSL